jgi:peptidoglycan/LPS O-acetylase OafA/YrhL
MKSRIEALDWLRGLMAFSIMLFHLSIWYFPDKSSVDIFGRLGIYAVSIFFILSGLSMAIVYKDSLINLSKWRIFFWRRFFRIWPLFFITTSVVLIIEFISNRPVSLKSYILNISLLFGFLKPHAYMVTGGWSIGNELVYYAFTPIILYVYSKSKFVGNLIFVGTLLLGLYFNFVVMNSKLPLETQWINYVNPFNNFFFFVSGIFLYQNFSNFRIKPIVVYSLLISLFLLFVFIPIENHQIFLVTGLNRVGFSIISFLIVFCFFKIESQNENLFQKGLSHMGVATYGIYLLHPIVKSVLDIVFIRFNIIVNNFFISCLIIFLTISLGVLTYKLIEKPMMDLGKKIFK